VRYSQPAYAGFREIAPGVTNRRRISSSWFIRFASGILISGGSLREPLSEFFNSSAFTIRKMDERRTIARTTISKNALLFFDEERGVFACHVRDIAKGGAGIQLHDLNVLPLNFELTFDNFHNIRRCQIIWRRGDFVGVRFLEQ
jgi:hypothetical protein